MTSSRGVVNQVGMPIDVRVVSCISIEIGRDATAFDIIYMTVDMKGFQAFPTESEVLSHNFERY